MLRRSVLSLVALLFALFSVVAQAEANQGTKTFTNDQKQAIENIVHDYLISHPTVMVNVFEALQKQQQDVLAKRASEAIHKYASQLFDSKESPVAGNPKGKVTLLEFFDYQCQQCKRMAAVVQNLIKANRELRVVYKELPIFQGSVFISSASLAAQNQGKYEAFHNALMNAPEPISETAVMNIAKAVGLNLDTLRADMKSPAVQEEIRNNMGLAGPRALNIMGTPTFIIASNLNSPNNIVSFFIPGRQRQLVLQSLIEQALNPPQQQAQAQQKQANAQNQDDDDAMVQAQADDEDMQEDNQETT